jgi:hypothetical protein
MTAPVIGQTALLVVKAVFGQTLDTFTLYVNPAPGGAEPTSGFTKRDANLSTVTGLTIYSTGGFGMDEIRVGETFQDVTPAVPEPGVIGSGRGPVLLNTRRVTLSRKRSDE